MGEQIREIARSIERFGFNNPVLVDERDRISRLLGLKSVPILRIEHLTETEKRAFVIADNKLAEKAGWDRVA